MCAATFVSVRVMTSSLRSCLSVLSKIKSAGIGRKDTSSLALAATNGFNKRRVDGRLVASVTNLSSLGRDDGGFLGHGGGH